MDLDKDVTSAYPEWMWRCKASWSKALLPILTVHKHDKFIIAWEGRLDYGAQGEQIQSLLSYEIFCEALELRFYCLYHCTVLFSI